MRILFLKISDSKRQEEQNTENTLKKLFYFHVKSFPFFRNGSLRKKNNTDPNSTEVLEKKFHRYRSSCFREKGGKLFFAQKLILRKTQNKENNLA